MTASALGARYAAAVLPPPSTPLRRAARLGAYAAPLCLATALGLPICPVAITLGQPCPGCGITRAALALVHADVRGAIAMNPVSPVIVPLALGLTLFACASYVWTGSSRMNQRVPMSLGIAGSLALTVVWAMRWFGAFGGPVDV